MSSTTSTFSKTNKFDSTNWSSWQRLIHTVAMAKGAFGYLDGSITYPSTPLATTPSSAETSWDSNTSSLNEWKARDAWTLGLLIFNTRNPAGLGININSIATETWTSYINTYEKASNMAQLNVEQTLQNMTYSDCTDFNNFIINMCNKWSDARALGSKINNKDFKDIIITSLPKSWNPIAAPLYDPNMT